MKTIRLASSGGTATAPGKGFTLVELLVVIAVVALLFSLRLAAIAGPQQDRSKVAQCAANLRQVTQALQIYAGENNEKLPVNPSGLWPWCLPRNIGNTLLACGLQKKNCYCPGTAPRFSDLENFADPTFASDGSAKNLWDFGITGLNASVNFNIVGYIFSFGGYGKLISSATNSTIQPEWTPNPVSSLFPKVYTGVSDRVLTADATIGCQTSGFYTPVPSTPISARYQTDLTYTEVQGGFYKKHISPHLNGRFPAGGNVGFKDGHVAWRKFDDMKDVTGATGGPSFWW